MGEVTALADVFPKGTFTIVRESDGKRVTIRIRDTTFARHVGGRAAGQESRTIAEFLSGPDNEADYTGFAFVDVAAGTYAIWAKQKRGEAWFSWALDVLKGDPVAAGEAYAMASGKCWKCGRRLTVPASLHRGMGPECAKRA